MAHPLIRRLILIGMFLAAGLFCISDTAQAQSVVWPAGMPPGTCTSDPQFEIPVAAPGSGLVSSIVTNIQNILTDVSKDMFKGIVTDGGFLKILRAMLTLYIAIYGILFTFGMVQITVFDFAMRMVKVGIIVWLMSPTVWDDFFNEYVVTFFNCSTDHIINQVTYIGLGGTPPPPYIPGSGNCGGSSPFSVLDSALAKALSANMAVHLLAMAFTGMYGVLFAGLLVMALIAFGMAMMTALWVYLMSLVLRTLLFGLAPIFLACLLFNRTRHLFDGWLNQVVNACLQPILLFIFFSFFVVLIEASMDNLLSIPVCWTHWAEQLRGSPFGLHYWRFTIETNPGVYEPYGGLWKCTGAEGGNSPVFPVDIMTILMFVMLAELASRFNSVVLMIARELAGASTDLSSMRGALGDWFSSARGKGTDMAGLADRGNLRRQPIGVGDLAGERSVTKAAERASVKVGGRANPGQ